MTSSPPRPETIDRLSEVPFASLAMLAGMQLDVFTPLKDGPMTAEQVAGALSVRPDKLRPLLYALTAAGLVTLRGDLFANTAEADHYLVNGKPDYVGLKHVALAYQWDTHLKTAQSIGTGLPQARVDYSAMSPEELESEYARDHLQVIRSGRDLVERYDFSSYRSLADFGGGSGGLSIAVAEACPDIRVTVVDLPGAARIAQGYVEEAGVSDRVRVTTADVVSGPLTGSFDVAVLRAFIQVLSPDNAHRAIMNVSKVIEPGGTIYIIGAGILDDSRVSPPVAVRFGTITLNRFDEGRAYTEQEHREWLDEAGFEAFERVTLPDGSGIITARRPT